MWSSGVILNEHVCIGCHQFGMPGLAITCDVKCVVFVYKTESRFFFLGPQNQSIIVCDSCERS